MPVVVMMMVMMLMRIVVVFLVLLCMGVDNACSMTLFALAFLLHGCS